MDAPWRIELLGWLRAAQGDQVVDRFLTHQTGALLAYLAYHLHRSHHRDALVEMLWPECDLDAGRHRLRKALSSLRHQLEPPGVSPGTVLITDRASVRLNPAAVETDVAQFEAALRAARRAAGSTERVHWLTEAVERYRGELLPGYFEEWVLLEQQRLAEAYLQAIGQLVSDLEQAGDLPGALQFARRAVSADPLREEARRELIRLLAAFGQPEAALQEYEELERVLAQVLGGATPEAATRALVDEIRLSGTRKVAPRRDAGSSPPAPPEVPLPPAAGVAPPTSPAAPPTGTVTFLLTDIEGHTALWQRAGTAFTTALASHHALLREQFRRHGGYEVKEMGDGFLVAFRRAGDALACAIAGQCLLNTHPWTREVEALRVRMALHTGDVESTEGDYHSLVLNFASRMLLAGHGGQILCSEGTGALIRRHLEPGARLTDLGLYRLRDAAEPERLFQVDYPDMPQREFPPLKAEAGHAGRLPLQFDRFFGREEELARLRELFLTPETRLVTLTGPGGSGKTRLAVAAAERLRKAFEGAIWFVPLADLSEPRQIPDQILLALRLPRFAGQEPLEAVVAFLSAQPTLLLLDNFEHLLGGATAGSEGAAVVRTLLDRVPALTLLVTSRQLLRLAGEQEFPVEPLPVPGEVVGSSLFVVGEKPGSRSQPTTNNQQPTTLLQYSSVQLFVDRAQAARPDFQVTRANAGAVAALCAGLEGIPLAIELAAARARVLTPSQMLERLQRRFELLTGRQRDEVARHRSLGACLDWSYQFLPPEQQRFFARLSVFRGGWTLEAAEAVCDEPLALDDLEHLRECSLVQAEESEPGMRFWLLETLREFGAEQLAMEERAAVARRHAEYYRALAEEAAPALIGPDQGEWLRRLERERGNVRAALEWAAATGETELGFRLATALRNFWRMRGSLAEARELLTRLLAVDAATPSPTILSREYRLARAHALETAAYLAWRRRDLPAECALEEESVATLRELGDRRGLAWGLFGLGSQAYRRGENATARALMTESLTLAREVGDKHAVETVLGLLAGMALDQGDLEAARSLGQERLSVCREVGDPEAIAGSLVHLGCVDCRQGEYEQAAARYREALALDRATGNQFGVTIALWHLGEVAERQGDYPAARAYFLERVSVCREIDDALAVAGSLNRLGDLCSAEADWEAARSFYQQSLALFQEIGNRQGDAACLSDLGAVAGAQGQPERGARLCSAAAALRTALGVSLTPKDERLLEERHATLRAALGEAAFNAAWQAGQALTLDQAIVLAREGMTPH